jgi:hypothetical protein
MTIAYLASMLFNDGYDQAIGGRFISCHHGLCFEASGCIFSVIVSDCIAPLFSLLKML